MIAKVAENIRLSQDVYVLKAEGDFRGKMGQFYMLRGWGQVPVLSRPISIHDIGEGYISFLFRIRGEGTELLARLRPGDDVGLEGPFGNGYPYDSRRVALVGGGMGTAPLLLAAREMPHADVYLGFSGEPFRVEAFQEIAASVTVNIGGNIVEEIDPSRYDAIFTCGPHPMMEALAAKTEGTGAELYVSVEKRMACGIGACLACTCRTKSGNRKACKDGPVFSVEEVDFDDLASL